MSRPHLEPRRAAAPPDDGYVLVLFALLFLPILALLSLSLDLGFAGLVQLRLEGASELAAREGPAGWRGAADHPSWCPEASETCDPAEEAAAWDAERRARASILVGNLFAPATADEPRVGPIQVPRLSDVELPGVDDAALLPQLDGTESRYADSAPLALNSANAPDGDLVSGLFAGLGENGVVATVPSCVNPEQRAPHGENCSYQRADFEVADFESPDTSPGRSLLARLRLSDEPVQAGVAQPGAALPVLFGRLVGSAGAGAGTLRERGLRLRSTAIADARPALAVAPPVQGGPGAARFAIQVDAWRALALDSPVPIAADAAGQVTLNGGPAGLVIAAPVAVWVAFGSALGGDPIPGPLDPPAAGESPLRYVPLYRADLSAQLRVVGFGVAELAGGTLQKRPARVAPSGASAAPDLRQVLRVDPADPLSDPLASILIDELFTEVREAVACNPEDPSPLALLCAPVRVR